jgi:hypothetical protein
MEWKICPLASFMNLLAETINQAQLEKNHVQDLSMEQSEQIVVSTDKL